ncbi:MAG: DUF86 domain-containing protein [Firmicutes bacterium]|nr:DUF86 domain-containing protein [Alicyclobacillaceae bacterium]MCL6497011.1 DUF86 domain-containing protein [Bacillota bacterium]
MIGQLEIAGEAAGRLSEALRQAHPGIAARELKALRNVLIHACSDVELETVWDVHRALERISIDAVAALWRERIRRVVTERIPALITEDGRVLGMLTPNAFGPWIRPPAIGRRAP